MNDNPENTLTKLENAQLSVLLDQDKGLVYLVSSQGEVDFNKPENIFSKTDLSLGDALELGLTIIKLVSDHLKKDIVGLKREVEELEQEMYS